MTRKKFIKSLMAAGVSRNIAAAYAATGRAKYGSYAASAVALIMGLIETIEKVNKIIPQLIEQVIEMLPAGGGGND